MSNISKVSVNGKGYNICDDYARSEYVKMANSMSVLTETVIDNSGKVHMLGTDMAKNTNDINLVKETIGSGELATTSQDLIGAINELKASGGSGGSASGGNGVYMTVDNPTFNGPLGGQYCSATGTNSIAVGYHANATNEYSIAVGNNAQARGNSSACFGEDTDVTGSFSMSFGKTNHCSGAYAFSGGSNCFATGNNTFAMGNSVRAEGHHSTCFGRSTQAKGSDSFVLGKYNIIDEANKYALILGNGGQYLGPNNYSKSNAFTIDWNGNGEFSGDITIHDTDGTSYSLITVIKQLLAQING